MADVRSMLRAERESRRITHPHASYTSAGTLHCNLCEVPIKSEKAWSAHLHSTQHNLRSEREKEVQLSRPGTNSTKKRKAVEFEDDAESGRKKAKAVGDASDKYPTPDQDDASREEIAGSEEHAGQDRNGPEEATSVAQDQEAALDELEQDLAALEREALADDRRSTFTAIAAAPTISAAATSANEQTKQEAEDYPTQRNRRELENEEDREDAARALEEEFTEMGHLQDRVKKLRDRREALREQPKQSEGTSESADDDANTRTEGDEDTDDDDDDYDDWKFGAG